MWWRVSLQQKKDFSLGWGSNFQITNCHKYPDVEKQTHFYNIYFTRWEKDYTQTAGMWLSVGFAGYCQTHRLSYQDKALNKETMSTFV